MITINIKCQTCNGTGLYSGTGERGKCAVVCNLCKGKGCVDFRYEEFAKREKRYGVVRVFESSHGFVHSHEDKNGIKFSKGGTSYEEWLKGADPKPVKDLYCPMVWTGQKCSSTLGCDKLVGLGNRISSCRRQDTKAQCWIQWEAQK
ncbi:hypothetical protein KAR91_53215 [Candidatus Pacearchaeota archaeon]|nr:hypothetical protein [Candidatus Pacearchaeota archaeon]